jgi:hypothetical protein
VNTAKLVQIPTAIPNDFALLPFEEAAKITGRRGHIQGARMVTSPDIKAKIRSVSISVLEIKSNTYIV